MPRALVTPDDAAVPIELEYETFGDPGDPAILLIQGTGNSLAHWPVEVCEALAGAGRFVIRFDNRDIGRSTKVEFDHDPTAVILAAVLGGPERPPYTAIDMAEDAAGLLDHLDVAHAHVVGVSLGGTIGQWLAIERPDVVASLTLIMSTTGEAHVGQPDPEVALTIAGEPRPGLDGAVERALLVGRALAGHHFDEDDVRRTTEAAWSHAEGPQNASHQLAAFLHTPPTAPHLPGVTAPTLVVHGALDRLVDPSGGRRIAELVPDAELLVVEEMGHDLPAPLRPRVLAAIDDLHGRSGLAGGGQPGGGSKRMSSGDQYAFIEARCSPSSAIV